MDANADLLSSHSGGKQARRTRKQLFKAIEDGDFRGVDFSDDDLDFRSSLSSPFRAQL